jgi:hypothetical protein
MPFKIIHFLFHFFLFIYLGLSAVVLLAALVRRSSALVFLYTDMLRIGIQKHFPSHAAAMHR